MGWAARANVSQGNPVVAPMRVRIILKDRHDKAVARHGASLVECSDRKYLMDGRGVLRRMPAQQAAEIDRQRVVKAAQSI